jgi:nitrite reductase/ring-hydroxylating ferredoxin subunit
VQRNSRHASIRCLAGAFTDCVHTVEQALSQPMASPEGGGSQEGVARPKTGFSSMAEQFVGKASEIKDGDRRIVFMGEHEIGVFKEKGEYFAYSNFCLHQGGPACEGLTIAKVEEKIMPDKTSRGLYFSDTELHFVCPWHGMEYDMKTGECVSDRKMRLRKYKIVQKGEDVYVVA